MEIKNTSKVNNLCKPALRKPRGVWTSPYSLLGTFRFALNSLTNGFFSFLNHRRDRWNLLVKEKRFQPGGAPGKTKLKVVFLGDIMVSKTGEPPVLDEKIKQLLRNADIIVANVESPVVNSIEKKKRSLFSLNFEMTSDYLKSIHHCNKNAKWVFSLANNHACDNSTKNGEDVSGVQATIDNIKKAIPNAEVIGTELKNSHSVLSLQIGKHKIGIVGWTEVMNHDHWHYRKKIVRDQDLQPDGTIEKIKRNHDFLIGFAHGNEEQSYYPLEETRKRWGSWIGKGKFDVIVGHGPHVLQPSEEMNGGIVFHSIGNFCSPIGKSQTKVGIIPELDFELDKDELKLNRYKVNILEQGDISVSLLEDHEKSNYPSIVNRLKKIWNTLF